MEPEVSSMRIIILIDDQISNKDHYLTDDESHDAHYHNINEECGMITLHGVNEDGCY